MLTTTIQCRMHYRGTIILLLTAIFLVSKNVSKSKLEKIKEKYPSSEKESDLQQVVTL
jgi:hypothetical protein